jgi:hypothetical protein
MKATIQHEFHPDAESLSAFAEQALDERERGAVLEHLAVCGRCRQVVALARDADDAAAQPRKTARTRAWWKSWQMAWIPAAALAATASLVVYVHVRQAERKTEMARLEPQAGAPAPGTAQDALHEDHAQPAPPAHAAKQEQTGAAEQPDAEKPHFATAQAPSVPEATEQDKALRQTPTVLQGQARQSAPQAEMEVHGTAYAQPAASQWETKQAQADQLGQAQNGAPRLRTLKANAAPGAGSGQSVSQPLSQASAPQETAGAAPPVGMAAPALPTISAGLPSQTEDYLATKPMPLPSGLAVVSRASRGPFMLAIDAAGTLFLSQDHGGTWTQVATQWTGRAVAVTREFAAKGGAQTEQSRPSAKTPAATPAAQPSVTFELLNDKNQAWVSTDGRTWTSK